MNVAGAGVTVTIGVPTVLVVVVHVVMPREKEQPAGTAEAGLPPVAALAVPDMTARSATDVANDAAIRTWFKVTPSWCDVRDDVDGVPAV
ncbi:hypothetical protein GCM10009858_16270 [Terrabacter carboxydivorans]|uniref:Uncharacterized protein n=1 Tax=Terrabacter carboxydivorans TaxID=619730 RepID=A0ABN3L824_9MICO